MKNSKKILALLILFVSVAMFSILPATASVLNEAQKHTTEDNGIQIEAKYKKVTSYKITFKGNGGKIGKKTKVAKNINKGSKIKKFPATPKRSGYTFKGWYSKKSGGKKISVNTKPTKSVTLYAQWKKGRTNTNSKLVGYWRSLTYPSDYEYYSFYKDGTFKTFYYNSLGAGGFIGKYIVSGNKIYLKSVSGYKYNILTEKVSDQTKYSNPIVMDYKIGTDSQGENLVTPILRRNGTNIDTYFAKTKFDRMNNDFILNLKL